MFKQGQELEEAGMYEQAALAYMDALRRDDDNIEALIALKSTAQIVVDEKYGEFFRAVQAGDDKLAIQSYREAENFRERLAQYNVSIARPAGHEADFEQARDRYCAVRYQEGRSALGAKDFSQAEAIFREINELKPDFKDVSDLLRLSQARPLYNSAMEAFDARKYRQAYRLFDQLERQHGEFENSASLKATALRNGQFGLGLMSFENHTNYGGVEALISSRVTRILQDKNDPFLKLIDRSMISQLTDEQIRAMQGQSDPTTAAEAGKLVGARAILVGELVSMNVEEGSMQRSRRPGYIGRNVTRTNSEGERYTVMTYSKVWYFHVEQASRVNAIFQFKLVDVETGEILATNAINITENDRVEYAQYNGETRFLYMGDWTSMDRDKEGDRILNDSRNKRTLDSQLRARTELNAIEDMKETVFNKISEQVASEVYDSYMNIQD